MSNTPAPAKEYCVEVCLYIGSGWIRFGGVVSLRKLAVGYAKLIAKHTSLMAIRVLERPTQKPWKEVKLIKGKKP